MEMGDGEVGDGEVGKSRYYIIDSIKIESRKMSHFLRFVPFISPGAETHATSFFLDFLKYFSDSL